MKSPSMRDMLRLNYTKLSSGESKTLDRKPE